MEKKLLNRLWLLLLDWRKIDFKSIFLSITKIAVIVTKPVLVALIPKIMIECIENEVSLYMLLLRIAVISFLIVVLSWIEPIISERINVTTYKAQNYYKMKVMDTLLFINYKQLESSKIKSHLQKIETFVNSGRFNSLESFYPTLIQFIASAFGIASYIVLFSKINSLLILVIFSSVIIDLLLLKWLKNKNLLMKKNTEDVWVCIDYFSDKSKDISIGKEIRIYSFADWFVKLSDNLINKLKISVNLFTKQTLIANILRSLTALARDLFILYELINNVSNGINTVSDFVFYFGLVTGFSTWILGVSQYYNNLKMICKEAEPLYDFFANYENKNKQNCSGEELTNILDCKTTSIEFKNVSFKYPENNFYTLKNVSFRIDSNEKIAIVGENGSGKSTCIKLLCGLYEPSEGEILINGININNYIKNSNYIKIFSAVFQDFGILPLSIRENITLGIEYKYNKLSEVIKKAGLKEKIDNLKNKENTYLVKEINKEAVDLSGGEIQKLLLARALYQNSKILILDEPTAALDPIAEDELYRKYSDFSNEKISIFISHRLSSTRFCDKIFFLSNGEIIKTGTHDQLIQNCEKYRQMYNAQSRYYK